MRIEHHSEMKEVQELTRLLITNRANDIKKAATIYARLLDKNPGAIAEVKECVPFVHWGRLEAVARGSLDPRLFDDFSIGAAQLRQVPLTVQKEVLDTGVVEVFEAPGKHKLKPLKDLSREEAYQAFDARNKCKRTENEQLRYRERVNKAKIEAAQVAESMPDYQWINGKLKLNVPMMPNEILKIIAAGEK